jgi:glutamyl-Q tRNA(Asp) synthetase
MAHAKGGTFLLRIEDIDQTRCKPHWEQQIYDDLHWLGLHWPTPALRQSDRLPAYQTALTALWQRGLLYPCTCTRRDIAAAASAPQEGTIPPLGPDGLIYPGTCRHSHNRTGPMPQNTALRLDMQAAAQSLSFTETGSGPKGQTGQIPISSDTLITDIGDIVLSRRDFPGSYHLSVVLDDATQNITHVIRGQDLFEATKIHILLQTLLTLPTPTYHHHRLIRDDTGKRLAKRDDARAITKYRHDGTTPADIRTLLNLP